MLKGGVQAAVVNNFIYDPGARAIHYNLMALEWGDHPYQLGELSAVGNVLRGGVSTRADIAFLMIGGAGDLRIHWPRQYRRRPARAAAADVRPLHDRPRRKSSARPAADRLAARPRRAARQPGRDPRPRHAGARPWDRDADDIRILFDVAEGRGKIIDDEREVGGYPAAAPTRAAFVAADWDLATMEPKSGRYPGQRDDFTRCSRRRGRRWVESPSPLPSPRRGEG